MRVLVVDDDADSREVTAAFLRASGFDVAEFESAEDVLPHVADADAVVTDITLPGMSGYDLAAALRADPSNASLVVFALSGRSDVSPEQAKLFHRVVVKPFDPDLLVRELQTSTGAPLTPISATYAAAAPVATPGTNANANGGRLSAEQYRLLVEHSPTLVWRADPAGHCDYFNETWLAFRGRTLEQELNDGWVEGIHPDDLSRCMKTFQDNVARRSAYEMDFRLRRNDGVFRTMLLRGIPLLDDAGVFCGFMGSCIDVDERASADRAKATFLGMMAHEMRTPLTPLRAYQVQLQRAQSKGEPITDELVKRLGRQIDRLAALVEHLGDAARLSTNRSISLTRTSQDLTNIVRGVVEAQQNVLATRRDSRHTPTLEAEGLDRERFVVGDKKRLEQLVRGIVENAVKFSPMGGAIHLKVETTDGEHRIVVSDSGIGIPNDELSSVGRPYFRASNAPPDNYPGLGLGLAVAKEIASAHGGWLKIEAGRGVRVTVSLPTAAEAAA